MGSEELKSNFKDFQKALSVFGNKHTDTNWIKRVQTLKKLKKTIQENTNEFSQFTDQILDLIRIQLKDQRTTVIRHSLEIFQAIIQLQQNQKRYIGKIVEILLEKLLQENQIVFQCLLKVLKISISLPAVHSLKNHMQNQSRLAKSVSLASLTAIIESHSNQQITPILPTIQEMIIQGLNSQFFNIQTASGSIFNTYKTKFPQQAQQILNQVSITGQQILKEVASIKISSTYKTDNYSSQQTITNPSAMVTQTENLSFSQKIEFVLEKTQNDSWSVRFIAFQRLNDQLKLNVQSLEPEKLFLILDTVIQHISDTHRKVQESAIAILQLLLTEIPQKITFQLQQILKKLIFCLSQNKKSLNQSVIYCLNLLKQICNSEDLLLSLLKIKINTLTMRARPELLYLLADLGKNVRLEPPQISAFLIQAITIHGNYSYKTLSKAVFSIFSTMNRTDPEILVQIINKLPDYEKKVCIRILGEFKSEFVQYCQIVDPIQPKQEQEFSLQLTKKANKSLKSNSQSPSRTSSNKNQTKKPIEFSPTRRRERLPTFSVTEYKFTQQELASNFQGSILAKCRSTGAARQDGLKKLYQLTFSQSATYNEYFRDVLDSVIGAITDPDPNIGLIAAHVIKAIFCEKIQEVKQHLEFCIREIVKNISTLNLERKIQQGLEVLVNTQDCEIVVRVFNSLLEQCEHPALLRQLASSIKRVSFAFLQNFGFQVIKNLRRKLEHQELQIRKLTVFCLAEILIIVKNDEYISQLSDPQQKLVKKYMKRNTN